ncbi:MAG: mechanosensitive ion channel [Dehalococcoidales bacterium]|nr:mechanosensitive ion channel [Dehalococcoidales bacterium]
MKSTRWTTLGIGVLAVALGAGILVMPLFRPTMAVYVTLVTLSLTLALQKYVASFAGYFVLRFSKLFRVGDRIRIGTY